ncbi:MFS transporter [Burkholderia orbicola]|uniref:MFS transporter n=5 Tax=Burkholderia cepacia complex TaxID=87882 RepID=A0A427NP35_9BURK|nr:MULTISPECIES: MFS transporter [Burkholderia]BEV50263.1 MFS transporter [Burkholderia contaminans]ABK11938.1 major facilitator superfamily MFS_1 [Burkholderia cenocepacia HI2424]ACA94202.1 major facilitator superfamily MFS_1 [Burkholderia orbicola MC0-3]AQQ29932.1 MFS transporter [Burkholderia cenocepacia]AQT53546.1 MFS transporter [Burkholderia cenocepacia]
MNVSLAVNSRAALMPAGFLALGTFAIGTEGFMIAPLLPVMAKDFGLPVPTVAVLVIVFTLVLALSSPISTVATGRMARKWVLLAAMSLFAIGNVTAAVSASFALLIGARVLMAIAAGLYVPAANGLAGVIVPPSMRGRALAIVSAGQTLAIALGLPLGGMIGHAFGWRATFLLVGAMSVIAIAGIFAGIARDAGEGVAVASLRERVSVIRQAPIQRLLGVSLFWSIGAFAAYPYIAEYLDAVLAFGPNAITATVSLWGLSAAAGVMTGGVFNDRFGANRVVHGSLMLLGLSFLALAIASRLPPQVALVPVLVAVAVWGFTVWSYFPAQMSRLIAAGAPAQAPVALALNTSTMYFGFSVGSTLGAAVLSSGAVWGIGAVAALAELIALALNAVLSRNARA